MSAEGEFKLYLTKNGLMEELRQVENAVGYPNIEYQEYKSELVLQINLDPHLLDLMSEDRANEYALGEIKRFMPDGYRTTSVFQEAKMIAGIKVRAYTVKAKK